jgi:hypothetical protein
LGEFEHRLLLAAMRLGTDACGMRLMEELSATVGRSVSRGSVYVTLDRMEGKGWIESELSESRLASRSRPADTSFRACRPRTCREITTSTIRTCLRGTSTRWVWNSCLGVRSSEPTWVATGLWLSMRRSWIGTSLAVTWLVLSDL